jgi:GNAT superfamily N-acetyltransferase
MVTHCPPELEAMDSVVSSPRNRKSGRHPELSSFDQDDRSRFLVAMTEASLIGGVGLVLVPPGNHDASPLFDVPDDESFAVSSDGFSVDLSGAVVDADWTGVGIEELLVSSSMVWAADLPGVRFVRSWISRNHALRTFYRELGFETQTPAASLMKCSRGSAVEPVTCDLRYRTDILIKQYLSAGMWLHESGIEPFVLTDFEVEEPDYA